MRIAWFSRHEPLPCQLTELRRLFGEYELVLNISPYTHADDVCKRLRLGRIDELVIVAPLSVLRALTERGVRPLRAIMQPCNGSVLPDLTYNGRQYKFLGFERVLGVEIKTASV